MNSPDCGTQGSALEGRLNFGADTGVAPPAPGSDASSPRPRFVREKPTHILRWNGAVLEQVIEVDAQYWDAVFQCSYWRTTTEWRAVPQIIPNAIVRHAREHDGGQGSGVEAGSKFRAAPER